MIFFGTKAVGKTIETGSFECPSCNQSTVYKHEQVNKYFTLYFIPLIPLGDLGKQITCTNCNSSFVPNTILNHIESKDAVNSITKKKRNCPLFK